MSHVLHAALVQVRVWRTLLACEVGALVLLTLGPSVGRAQDTNPVPVVAAMPPIPPGARLRVTVASLTAAVAPTRIVGRFMGLDTAALWLNTAPAVAADVWPGGRAPAPVRVQIPRATVQRVDLEVPKRGSRRSRMLVGAAVAGTVGGVLLYNAGHGCPRTQPGQLSFCFDLRSGAAGAGVIAGAALGALGGYLRGPKMRWRAVALPTPVSPPADR